MCRLVFITPRKSHEYFDGYGVASFINYRITAHTTITNCAYAHLSKHVYLCKILHKENWDHVTHCNEYGYKDMWSQWSALTS